MEINGFQNQRRISQELLYSDKESRGRACCHRHNWAWRRGEYGRSADPKSQASNASTRGKQAYTNSTSVREVVGNRKRRYGMSGKEGGPSTGQTIEKINTWTHNLWNSSFNWIETNLNNGGQIQWNKGVEYTCKQEWSPTQLTISCKEATSNLDARRLSNLIQKRLNCTFSPTINQCLQHRYLFASEMIIAVPSLLSMAGA